MTAEQQRIAIAEACGWKDIRRPAEDKYHELPTETLGFVKGSACGIPPGFIHCENSRALPDYLNDLNAMHEAEREIGKRGLACQLAYLHFLSPVHSEWTLATSTAAQRAKAFLKALNLWTPNPHVQ